MFSERPDATSDRGGEDGTSAPVEPWIGATAILGALALLLIGFGVYPDPLLRFISASVGVLLPG